MKMRRMKSFGVLSLALVGAVTCANVAFCDQCFAPTGVCVFCCADPVFVQKSQRDIAAVTNVMPRGSDYMVETAAEGETPEDGSGTGEKGDPRGVEVPSSDGRES